MTPSSRDRISVDLNGLKAALFERAQALGISPSGLVREALATALGRSEALTVQRSCDAHAIRTGDRVRLSLRIGREQASVIFEAARRARLSPGDYVAGLGAYVPVLSGGASRTDHLAALVASSAELSTLSRNIHHLTALLRQGAVRPAQEYREMLDTLASDVRGHLMLASRVLADLRPRGGIASRSRHSNP